MELVKNKTTMNNNFQDTPLEFKTSTKDQKILNELLSREPLFHKPEHGREKGDLMAMTDERFFEVGASGEKYNRMNVVNNVTKRYEDPDYQGVNSPPEDKWVVKDAFCRQLEGSTYLITYTLFQGERVTRRATVWQKNNKNWKIIYHQGTIVQ